MTPYPKKILSLEEQLQALREAKMQIDSVEEAKKALTTIGYYRLRGYCFHLYRNESKEYKPGTNFSNILKLYQFDTALSYLLFSMTSQIEVALRARLSEALLVYQDALILMDSTVFRSKEYFWKNLAALSSEVARSNDVFILHHYENHEGQIPLWAAVEVMSFGTLSKIIKNLKTGSGSAYSVLAAYYPYQSIRGNMVPPSQKMLSSWIQSVSVLRNICAHNGRIYNRTISTFPELLDRDKIVPVPPHNGLYQIVLAMKYLRPSDQVWIEFTASLKSLFAEYDGCFEWKRINFPPDWEAHLQI